MRRRDDLSEAERSECAGVSTDAIRPFNNNAGGDARVIGMHEYRARRLEAAIRRIRERLHRLRQLRVRTELSAGRLERELMELDRDLRACRQHSGDGPRDRHR
jgi:hypothetical protein